MIKYGISILSIIPVRIDSNNKSEMTSQILFGEHFKILKEKKNWCFIQLDHDKYKGWICNKQFTYINKDEYDNLSIDNKFFTKNIISKIKDLNNQTIVLGSTLPSYSNKQIKINNRIFNFYASTYQSRDIKKDLIKLAYKFLNTPYMWGGRTIFGIDCSGFTQLVYRLNGINIPRDAYQQAKVGSKIKDIKNSNASDLAFFGNQKITHVGIILKNNNIIHASGEVRIDKIDGTGIYNEKTGDYTHKLKLIKRIVV
tara:strand:+ start:20328 stop:21092 length:765 start_codon:yes stop_codon:yes gene_type:complete